jgi:hypothetical protein
MFFAPEKIQFPSSIQHLVESSLLPRGKEDEQRYARSLLGLWEKLAIERGQTREAHYSFQSAEARAYAAYYMPINCLKGPLVLEEAHLAGESLLNEEKNTWLDVGTGPGTLYLGLQWWLGHRKFPVRFFGIDQSENFLRIADDLVKNAKIPVPVTFQAMKKKSILQFLEETNATHLSFVNSIAEIFPDLSVRKAKLEELVKSMGTLSKRDGAERFIVIIEPASRQSSRELSELKDHLAPSVSVMFPCLDNRKCGALAKPEDWCHEEVACEFPDWIQRIGVGASMQKAALLFSYVVLRIGGPKAESPQARIVSQRLERKGQTECWICQNSGKRMVRAQKSKQNEFSHLVTQGNRGDLWNNYSLGEKGDLLSAEKFQADSTSVFSPPSEI